MGERRDRRPRQSTVYFEGARIPVLRWLERYAVIEEHPNCLIAIETAVPRRVVLRFRELGGRRAAEREARVLLRAASRCESVPRILQVCRLEGREYLIMEWIKGRPLAECIDDGVRNRKPYFAPEKAHFMVLGLIKGGLLYLHGGKIYHGDIKPDNIVVTPTGRLKLIDFGMAWRGEQAQDRQGRGSKGYAAPELWQNERLVDFRADQFSLSAILYEMLTNELPYSKLGGLVPPARHAGLKLVPTRRANRRVWPELDAVLARGLQLDKEKRYPTTRDWLDAMEEAGRARENRDAALLVQEAMRGFLERLRGLFPFNRGGPRKER